MSAGLALISCKQFPFRIYWGDFPQFQLPLENERLSRKLLWYQCTVIQPSQRYQPASTAPWFIDGVYINPDIIPSSIVSLSNIITSHWVYSILTFPLWFSQASQLKGRVKFHPPPQGSNCRCVSQDTTRCRVSLIQCRQRSWATFCFESKHRVTDAAT